MKKEMKYLIYDEVSEKYFQSQDNRSVIWSDEGIAMDAIDAEIRVMIIEKNYPDMRGRLTIIERK